MADETSNLVLEHLRHIRRVVDETREEVKRLVLRTGLMDKERLNRIERRLELVAD